MDVKCGGCDQTFEAKTSRAQYCSTTCRSRAARQRKAAAESVEADAEKGLAEHQLVRATRLELEKAGVVDTVEGQLTLQLARKLANPDESGISTLSKEFRAVRAEALEGSPEPAPTGDTPPAVDREDDEVTRARRAREQKLSAAAGRA
ncbi:hypothetical protein [Nocardioides sp. 503]|uniref:hypothetical protein n=1 Tax=Nocardioides sp. 503 TaxID=2508326 RepID=UPI001070449E|nr:hypothetical protein [Nocardioides sp. 503]